MQITIPPHQFRRISDFAADLAQVSVASIAIPYVLDTPQPMLAVLGIAVAVFFYAISYVANQFST